MYLRIAFLILLCFPVFYIIYLLFNYLYIDIKKEKIEKTPIKLKEYDYYNDDIYIEYAELKKNLRNKE